MDFFPPLHLHSHSLPPRTSRLTSACPFTPNTPADPGDSFHGNISKAQNVVAESVISVFEVSDSSRVSRHACMCTSHDQRSDVCTVGWFWTPSARGRLAHVVDGCLHFQHEKRTILTICTHQVLSASRGNVLLESKWSSLKQRIFHKTPLLALCSQPPAKRHHPLRSVPHLMPWYDFLPFGRR